MPVNPAIGHQCDVLDELDENLWQSNGGARWDLCEGRLPYNGCAVGGGGEQKTPLFQRRPPPHASGHAEPMAEDDLSKLIAKEILPQTDNWPGTEKFLRSVVEVLLNYIREENVRTNKILEFHHPAEMQQLIDLSIPEQAQDLQHLVKECEKVLRLGVRTGHPRFFNQISCGLDLVSMAGEWLTATANTNMFTYEIAPVYILMEKAVMKRMWEAIGWDPDQSDGIFAPGGAIANLYALSTARHALYPRSKYVGLKDVPTLCAFTSEDSHYSIKSAAALSGIGTDFCFNIPTDKSGKMIPEALEQKIIESKKEGQFEKIMENYKIKLEKIASSGRG
ncbi:hypothetical protein Y032_0009g723 [Ancylostoma ceylanicum]|uniref:Glutamate decarboxylase n=1 Tax=Ancylostoma ceylanicum TaxID=53326 RepID=A0A016VJG3_9BILA|nr:hypothetical protein Y032_0009g723 [Ancylostoma ceylanicum]